jgi:hypothetical protein
MAKAWKQVGGDVNPKMYGAVLARVDESGVEVVRIETDDEDESHQAYYVTSGHFYKSDLEWGGQAHPEKMAGSMGFDQKEWDDTDLAGRGAIALQYHGSGWSGQDEHVMGWAKALPAKSNQIEWWKR